MVIILIVVILMVGCLLVFDFFYDWLFCVFIIFVMVVVMLCRNFRVFCVGSDFRKLLVMSWWWLELLLLFWMMGWMKGMVCDGLLLCVNLEMVEIMNLIWFLMWVGDRWVCMVFMKNVVILVCNCGFIFGNCCIYKFIECFLFRWLVENLDVEGLFISVFIFRMSIMVGF